MHDTRGLTYPAGSLPGESGGLIRDRDPSIESRKLAHNWVTKSLADRPFSVAYAATLFTREGGILKDWLILRSRLSLGRGIDTYGTMRVFAEMLIGTLLEILLDMRERYYYDCTEIGRHRMLYDVAWMAQDIGVDLGSQERS